MKRYQINGSPWLERNGLECVIVEPPPNRSLTYPWDGKIERDVVVFIENDPLAEPNFTINRSWTCVLPRTMLSPVEEGDSNSSGATGLAFAHHYHRDKMNAAAHASNPKFSPITFLLAQELRARGVSTPEILEVRAADGKYQKDYGR